MMSAGLKMRITSGTLKNRRVEGPGRGAFRPTSDKARAAFFSSVGDIEGCAFLDLFAGTGAVGIEAFSRGASRITFVDAETSTLKKNLALLPKGSYELIQKDIFKADITGVFDIIYIDPPYSLYPPAAVLERLKNCSFSLIGYEEGAKTSFDHLPQRFRIAKERFYGDTKIIFLEVIV